MLKKKNMKKFIITETRPVTATWTYEVEAENERDALEKIFTYEGAKLIDYEVDDNGNADDSEFDITEQEQ